MMCYKPKEQFPSYTFLQETNAALRFFTNSLKEIQAKPNPDPDEIYYLLCWTWKTIGYNADSIDKLLQKPERRIMEKENEIEGLITNTIAKIKAALDNNKPGEAKVYTEILHLLKYTLNIQSPGSNRTLRTTSGDVGQTYEKPFEKISEKHIPDA